MPNKNIFNSLLLIFLGGLIGGAVVYYNPARLLKLDNLKTSSSVKGPGKEGGEGNVLAEAAAYLKFKAIRASFVPSGIPRTYGQELGISFDKVQDAINKTAVLDPTYGGEGKKIALTDFTAAELERYKKIGFSIACEYCCGVKTLTREDGTAACGCAHSQMMRGLAAYLIKNYPQEFTDEGILEELTKWKRTYFPKQTLSAELDRLSKAGEPGIEQILKEFPDFLPQMVGGC